MDTLTTVLAFIVGFECLVLIALLSPLRGILEGLRSSELSAPSLRATAPVWSNWQHPPIAHYELESRLLQR